MSAPRKLLESLVDGDDCHFDHHGGCQAHGHLSLESGEACPQAELKALLASGVVPDTGQALERVRVAGRNLLDALEEAEVDESFNPPTVANLRHYMTALEALVEEDS